MTALGGSAALIFLCLAVAIAWIILPFAIIGTKPILRDLLNAVKENNRLTTELHARLTPPTKPLYTEGAYKDAV